METVREILKKINVNDITQGIELYEGEYVGKDLHSSSYNFHTDFINEVKGYEETLNYLDVINDEKLLNREVENYGVFDSDLYNETILANSCINAITDFGWKKKDKILVILLKPLEEY